MKKTTKTYFVRKEAPKRSDYRFNYQRTPESALHFYVGKYREEERRVGMSYTTKFVKAFHKMWTFDTRDEAEAFAYKLNKELEDNNGMSNFMKAVCEGKI